MENPSYSGGCLCGHIRFQARGLPGNPHSCSCDFCRRHSGAPTLCWVEFPRQAIPALYRSSPYSSRAFCPRCGSTLGAIDDEPTVALATGSFDRADLPELRPTSHAFADVCPEWWRIDGMR